MQPVHRGGPGPVLLGCRRRAENEKAAVSKTRYAGLAFYLIAQLISGAAAAHENHPYKIDAGKLKGPLACAECHKPLFDAWKQSHHARAAQIVLRRPNALAIAKAMGLKRIKGPGLCLDCHFSLDSVDGVVAGIPLVGVACESCHGAAGDWYGAHSRYGMKEATSATVPATRGQGTYIEPKDIGMITPSNLYGVAANCLGCHSVSNEKLVDRAGHSLGRGFELVAWSQGEVRHNLWFSRDNPEASPARKRKMYVIGKAVDLEFALRALARIGAGGDPGPYAVGMTARAQAAIEALLRVALLVRVRQVDAILDAVVDTRIMPPGDPRLAAAADKVSVFAQSLNGVYLGTAYTAMDPLIPTPNDYKGRPPR